MGLIFLHKKKLPEGNKIANPRVHEVWYENDAVYL